MRLQIIHTNDLHSHLEKWPVLSQFIEETQREAKLNNIPILTVDVGDAIDSYHPMIEATFGKTIIDLFNQANYDIVTIGNNEGLNFPKWRLEELYSGANYDVVLANLLDRETQEYPSFVKSYIIKEIQGVSIAFIGLTAPYDTYNLLGYKILDPIKELQDQLCRLKREEVDLIILLSHLGVNHDRYIAQLFPEIGLIIGSHTHHVFLEGKWVNQSLLCAAGKHGDYIGLIDLFFDEIDNDWNFTSQIFTIEQLSRNYRQPIEDERYVIQGRDILSRKEVAQLPFSYYALELEGQQSFIQMALDCICEYSGTELAFLSSGLFLQDLPKGIINEKDLHDALPHPIHLSRVNLLGEDLLTLLDEIDYQSDDLKYKLISGNGFRGKVFGEIIFRGIEYHFEDEEWLVLGNPINKKINYQICTVDHLHYLPFFPTLEEKGHPQIILPDFIRHIIRNYLEKKYPLSY